ncbi:AMP-binding protein [uncultured Microbulbifer sp.]|uniref:AMP-binding protein n=1 Tax=uncultured Microbulbifer sp. TaxID=348147 RepID=UPI0026083F86|nr:AMP-binding protein [uncultured Microbulbifer sp.]
MNEVQFEQLFGYQSDQAIVSHTDRGKISFVQFKYELAFVANELKKTIVKTGVTKVALFCEDSYEFSLLFFAALSCTQSVVIPANNKRFTQQSFGKETLLLGDWANKSAFSVDIPGEYEEDILPPDYFTAEIQLFTSGTSGEPQIIVKTLQQLLNEIITHDKKWPSRIANTTILATVSHQHIYGLLFKLLWPVVSGWSFVSKTYVDIVGLLKDASKWSPSVWIASPAQLSRRISSWPWELGKSLTRIFSSGGPLQEADAKAIYDLCGVEPIEVYGSTETGGIAWRNQLRGKQWNPLEGVKVTEARGGLLQVFSPWLPRGFICQDRVKIYEDGSFELQGRADRIVKLEEKRISLTQIESLLMKDSYIVTAHALTVERKRKAIAIVATLTESGNKILENKGKSFLVRQLRESLSRDLDGVALPRSWRFVNEIPTNTQGKITRDLLMQLFDVMPAAMAPQIINSEFIDSNGKVEFTVNSDLPCLTGHFDASPVVPGVVQLDWAMHFGRPLLKAGSAFSHMEVIKFKQLMMPGDSVILALEFNQEKNRLTYSFRSVNDSGIEYSSGRLCFGHV